MIIGLILFTAGTVITFGSNAFKQTSTPVIEQRLPAVQGQQELQVHVVGTNGDVANMNGDAQPSTAAANALQSQNTASSPQVTPQTVPLGAGSMTLQAPVLPGVGPLTVDVEL